MENNDDQYSYFIEEISRLLTQLDTVRVALCNVSKQLYEYQSAYDKNDQTYLHSLETLNTNDTATITKFVSDWQSSRNNRRDVKDLIEVVGRAIDVIPYKNYQNAISVLKPYKR